MYFEQNTQALVQADPTHQSLIERLLQTPPAADGDFILFETEQGQYTLQYRGLFLHDLEAPLQEARKVFKSSAKSGEDRVHLLLGLGLGYILDETFQNSPGQIVVYEPDMAILRFALENVDLTEIFRSGRVRLAATHFDLLAFLRARIYSDFDLDILILPSAATLLASEIPVLVQKMKALIVDWARDYRTVQRFHLQWMEQFFNNFPSFATTETIEQLFNRFQGKPALVISRGPSLDAALDSVKALADSTVLIAVGSAVRRLWEHGLSPDFAVFYDANGIQEQLHGIPDAALEKITFILCPSTQQEGYTSPSRGKLVFFSQNGRQMCDWMDQTLGRKHLRLEGGGTVSLIAMQLALAMGCQSVILVGQDLAFPNNQVYAGGIALQTDDQGNMTLPSTATLYAEPEAMATVRGQNGETLQTLSAYTGFIRHFEALAAKVNTSPQAVQLYNASIGGAAIEGYVLKPLSEFIGVFPAWKKGFALETPPILSSTQIAERTERLQNALKTLHQDLLAMVSLCRELEAGLPEAGSVSDHQLEDSVWESTQRLFRFIQQAPFVSFLAMFEIIPYKQRFKAFANAETFDPSIRQDFIQALQKSVALLTERFLPWIERASAQLAAVGSAPVRESAPPVSPASHCINAPVLSGCDG